MTSIPCLITHFGAFSGGKDDDDHVSTVFMVFDFSGILGDSVSSCMTSIPCLITHFGAFSGGKDDDDHVSTVFMVFA